MVCLWPISPQHDHSMSRCPYPQLSQLLGLGIRQETSTIAGGGEGQLAQQKKHSLKKVADACHLAVKKHLPFLLASNYPPPISFG